MKMDHCIKSNAFELSKFNIMNALGGSFLSVETGYTDSFPWFSLVSLGKHWGVAIYYDSTTSFHIQFGIHQSSFHLTLQCEVLTA
jgi:hypothetical protein